MAELNTGDGGGKKGSKKVRKFPEYPWRQVNDLPLFYCPIQ
jgi:hypothetical protein